ncbi:MAG: hypothetical protein OXI67_07505 [Candidatus Poribacteria bacterium]|nr:hypothetical protein [Candidatus Poribacteria bacterium]
MLKTNISENYIPTHSSEVVVKPNKELTKSGFAALYPTYDISISRSD